MTDHLPTVALEAVPAVTAEQMREVDRIMIEDVHLGLLQMMENAGRSLARLVQARFGPRRVLVLAGPGGNGGGGMTAARHLANAGVEVAVVLAGQRELSPAAAHQLDVLDRMGVEIRPVPVPADLVLDALIGYSLHGDPGGATADLIEWTAGQPAPVLALDTPSGLDATTGAPGTPCVSATATLTLAAPKTGLLRAPETGDLYLADISVPAAVYRAFDLTMPVDVFAAGPLVRLVS